MKIRVLLAVLGTALTMMLGGCYQYVTKPQMEVQLKPIEWQSPTAGFTEQDKQALASWLNQFPTRDVYLQTAGSQRRAIKRFLLEYGFRTWQLDEVNFISAATTPAEGQQRLVGVVVQRRPAACPDWSVANLSESQTSRSSNFGCASQRNLMASVADSRDFIRGKALAPASAEKMVLALQQYYGRPAEQAANDAQANQQDSQTRSAVTSNLGQGN